jgi:hypothetical protein
VRYLAVKLVKLLPGLADEPPPPNEQALRVAEALRRAKKRSPDDDPGGSVGFGGDMEPRSPWD